MGVPSFYRWLVMKYPNIIVKAQIQQEDDSSVPNGFDQFDNLYLDMNNIIHPCFHPDDPSHPFPPTTFEQVHAAMFEYVDHIFSIVRPRKLLYMAIDGVGPRAKMNQQRARRFRAAKDNDEMEEEEDGLRKQFEMEGKQLLPKLVTEVSDSNIITPGTEFMFQLSKKLEQYVTSRMETCPSWKDIKVVISDSNVPGEGEHKIMSFIRHQRSLPGYNPNTRHCIYGLDADLILLALATHEVHFSILREDVSTVKEDQPVCVSSLKSSLMKVEASEFKSRGWFGEQKPKIQKASFIRKPYLFLQIWTLRDYLEIDMNIPDPPEKFTFDLERAIDDFVFICSFAGNDFLPLMPTLEIREGALDLLMTVYKEHFKSFGGYLVDMQRVQDPKNGFIKLKRVEKFILEVGKFEDQIFKKRSDLKDRMLENIAASFSASVDEDDVSDFGPTSNGSALTAQDQVMKNTMELKEKLRDTIRKKSDLFRNGGLGTDKVKLGSDGWRKRYYEEKFSSETTTKDVVQKYTEGLLWVLQYYYSGVPSWKWYYPYHYGPFASDLKGLAQVKVKFQKESPFKPFEQLMAVLPPRSCHALPKPYQRLMTDVKSNIIDFYPTDFVIDMHGKRFSHQGICELPFVDEQLLLAEMNKIEKELKAHEIERNKQNTERLYMSTSSFPEDQLFLLCSSLSERSPKQIDISQCGIGGLVRLSSEEFDVDGLEFQELKNRKLLCVFFELPCGTSHHIPRPLEGTSFPDKTITETDIESTQLWHEIPVRRNTNNNRQRSNWSRNTGDQHHQQQHYNNNYPMNWNTNFLRSNHVSANRFTANHNPPTPNVKPAGSGFSTGRGRGDHANPPPATPAGFSSVRANTYYTGRGQQNPYSGNYNGWRQPLRPDDAAKFDHGIGRAGGQWRSSGNYASVQGYGRGHYYGNRPQGNPGSSWRRET